MLRWAIIALLVAVIMGVLGFTDLAGEFRFIARVFAGVFLVMFVIGLALEVANRKK